MKNSQLRVLPTRFTLAKKQVAEDPAVRIVAVEQIIAHVNTVMACTQVRNAYRCDPAVGSFWQIPCPSIAVTPTEVSQLQQLFEEAGWPAVQVNFWSTRCTVTLAEHEHHSFGPPMHNGEPVVAAVEAIGGELTARQKRELIEQQSERQFAFAA